MNSFEYLGKKCYPLDQISCKKLALFFIYWNTEPLSSSFENIDGENTAFNFSDFHPIQQMTKNIFYLEKSSK